MHATYTLDAHAGLAKAQKAKTMAVAMPEAAPLHQQTAVEAALLGRIDQMLRTAVQEGVWRGICSPKLKTDSPGLALGKLWPSI